MRKICKRGQRKTTCSKCGKEVEQSRKGQGYCKSCHAAYARANRPLHKDLKPEARLKANARAYTKEYLKRGKIFKQPCEICSDYNSEAHHPDYTKPLLIIWLCKKHHLELHEKQKLYNKIV